MCFPQTEGSPIRHSGPHPRHCGLRSFQFQHFPVRIKLQSPVIAGQVLPKTTAKPTARNDVLGGGCLLSECALNDLKKQQKVTKGMEQCWPPDVIILCMHKVKNNVH